MADAVFGAVKGRRVTAGRAGVNDFSDGSKLLASTRLSIYWLLSSV